MSDISRSRTIAAPSDAVWDVLADFAAISTWVDNVGHSCLLNHGTGGEPVGTTRRVQVGRNTLLERITEFDAPTTLAYDIEGLPARLGKVANRWTLRPTGAETPVTFVTLTSTLKIGTRPPARLAERALLRFVAKQSDQLLAALAHRLENTHD